MLSGIVAMLAVVEAFDVKIGVSSYLNEFGINRMGTLDEMWEVGMDDPPSGTCALCNGCIVIAEIAQMPCCKGYLHAECLYGLLKQRHRACPLCSAPCPRIIPDPTKDFIKLFNSMPEGDQSTMVQTFAMEDNVLLGKLFGFIHPASDSPLPDACLTSEEMLAYIVNHPAPTPITKHAASIVKQYLGVGLPMQCAYWVSMLVCPTLEYHLFPMSLYREEIVAPLCRLTPTRWGRYIAYIGGLLHFNVVS